MHGKVNAVFRIKRKLKLYPFNNEKHDKSHAIFEIQQISYICVISYDFAAQKTMQSAYNNVS